MNKNENCVCKRVKCERHGRCVECRAHHAGLKRPVACEKEKGDKKPKK